MQLSTWYVMHNSITEQQLATFLNNVVGLFADTLIAMWNTPILRFFIAFSMVAVIFALGLLLMKTAKSGKL